jgi:trans-aconitate methyltransferase
MNAETIKILDKYPKQRPALPQAQQTIYQKEYKDNRDGATFFSKLSQMTESWMHKQVASSGNSCKEQAILELGAGTLNQVPYEFRNPDSTISTYDIVEPQAYLYESSDLNPKVNDKYSDIREVSSKKYDRIISIAVLEHLTDLPEVTARSALMLNEGGTFHHGIPNEGQFLWGLAWRITTGLSYKLRTGYSYKNMMKHEHVNTSKDILECLNLFFDEVEVKRFPTPMVSMSIYLAVRCRKPKVEFCKQFLERSSSR